MTQRIEKERGRWGVIPGRPVDPDCIFQRAKNLAFSDFQKACDMGYSKGCDELHELTALGCEFPINRL